ncbi:STAS domain-containing protein [Halomonas vilamensis]|uniref:STAS domain-containing protein n=1 Tax=Vreelandella vilamensis TaxID=531309 RepID=A0ABU1H343_9GAMM|nr:STAS domain-containing protein [Halomonas vilamensis]MDR5898092.1 STAS domain-containing protein [Halomonas vilamensis]
MTALFSELAVSLEQQNDTLSVSGDVGTNVATALAAAGSKWIAETSLNALHINFEGVEKPSSAAISVLLQWLRLCQQRHIDILSVSLSTPLQRLAHLAELDALLQNPTREMAASAT